MYRHVTELPPPDGEPPRVKKFRLELVKAIPRIPNNPASLRHMQQKHLRAVLIDYLNWRARYVGSRPRQIEIEAAAKADRRWSAMSAPVAAFLEKVRRGDDLTPHLSLAPHTRGYALAARAPGVTSEDKWSDKDFLLTTMGCHHFHLGTATEPAGHVSRTDELIFAQATRDAFKVIAIFDHEVFDHHSAERMRLWRLHNQIALRGAAPGQVVVDALITTSGHALRVVHHADRCVLRMQAIEPRLDDRTYVEKLFADGEIEMPPKTKLEWAFFHLDLAIYDRAKRAAFIVQRGWN
jgi:hypothetical protein